MIVRTLGELIGTDKDVNSDNWRSRRFLLKDDGMGFSLHDTVIRAGTETRMWYKHHLEAVYCIEGDGEVETVPDATVYQITAGTMYALSGHEDHILRAHSEMRMICVFNPPVTGREVHNEEGAYELIE